MDHSAPLTHHDPRDLGLTCLVKKREIHFRILSNFRIQSWIFFKKPILNYNTEILTFSKGGYVAYVALNLVITLLRPRLYGEKLSWVKGSPAYPSYPGRANFSYISLQNLANRLYEKQKVGSARRVTRLAGSPFCDGRVTLLAGPTFLHINTLARSAGTTPRKLKSVFYLKNEHCGLNCYQRS